MQAANDNAKTCTTCGAGKTADAFAKDKTKRDGFHTKCKSCVKAYKAANAEIISAQRKNYRQENKESIAAYQLEYRPVYRAHNRTKLVADSAKWKANNPERAAEISRTSRKRHAETSRSSVRNRRARLAACEGRHTAQEIQEIGAAQRWRCACCKIDLKKSGHQVDHIHPIAAGGDNDRSNLQLLCAPCNQSKNARDPVEFMQSRGFLC